MSALAALAAEAVPLAGLGWLMWAWLRLEERRAAARRAADLAERLRRG